MLVNSWGMTSGGGGNTGVGPGAKTDVDEDATRLDHTIADLQERVSGSRWCRERASIDSNDLRSVSFRQLTLKYASQWRWPSWVDDSSATQSSEPSRDANGDRERSKPSAGVGARLGAANDLRRSLKPGVRRASGAPPRPGTCCRQPR